MVKGAQLKSEITKKILEIFEGSFLYNDGKEIRINGIEDGNPVQIKVTLTCAKTAVGEENDTIDFTSNEDATAAISASKEKIPDEPSDEEKERLKKLLESLNLS